MIAVHSVIVTIRKACTKSLASTAHEPPAKATIVTTTPRTMALRPTPEKNSRSGSLIQV